MHNFVKSMICMTMAFIMLFSSTATAETLSTVSVEAAPLTTQSASVDGMVRVYLSSLGSPSSLSLTVSGNYSLSDGTTLSSGETLTVSFNSSTGALTLQRSGTTYSMGTSFTLRRHSTTGSNGIKISQARKPSNLYPGDIEFKAVALSSGGYKLYTIAHIYIENYLYGVVPYEMGSSAPIEALKAQAVAARTYTVRMMSTRSSSLYDVVDTTGDQTYNGTPTSVTNCNTAVDATKGIVLKYGSSYAATYYSSSNGGQTEAVKNAWGSTGYPYLDVHDDPFDYANPDSVVKKATVYADADYSGNSTSLISLLKSKAVTLLSNAGYNATSSNTTIQTITDITPHTPKYSSPSKLYTKMDFTVTVTTYNASNTYVSVTTTVTCDIFDELESLLGISIQSGENELWSVVDGGSYFTIEARRYGHGIGMSQRGAMYMAQIGYTYDEILGFYYQSCTRVGTTFTNTILAADSSEQIVTDEDPVEIDDSSGVRGTVSLSSGEEIAIRSTKSTSGSVLAVLSNGTPVTVLADYGTWCKIAYGSIIGYVLTSTLSITGTAPSSDDNDISDIDGFAVVKSSSYLNLREYGSYSASILSTAPNGAILTVFSWGTDWAHIQYGKLEAYAATDFLTFYASYPEDIQEGDGDTGDDDDTGDTETLTATVATESGSLNMRKLPKAGSTVITTIPQYAAVTVTDLGDTWSGVTYLSYEGYVMTAFLSFEDVTDDTGADEAVDIQAMVTTESGSLNLRAEAKAGSSIYCTIPQYEIIQVHTKSADWCQVAYNGITGYVMTAFLSFIDDSDDTSDDTGDDEDDDSADDTQDGSATAIVNTSSGSLNLRADALSGSEVLARIPSGESIPVLQKLSAWTYTCYQEYYGYVMNAFLTFSGEADDPSETTDPTTAIVVTQSGSLNLRNEPYGSVLTTIPQNAAVDVYIHGSVWCYLEYNGVLGYVMTDYLSFDESDVQQSQEEDDETGDTGEDDTNLDADEAMVNVGDGSLNLRAAKSTDAVVLARIPDGTVVTLLIRTDDWCKVTYGTYQGYVQTEYLTFASSAEPTITPEPTDTPEPTNTPEPTDTPAPTDTPEPTATPYSMTAWVCTPDDGSLNLRIVPNGRVLLTIPQNAEVTVLSDITATWCETQYGDTTGYTMSEFLTTTQPSEEPEATETPEPEDEDDTITAWVNTPEGSLNLRSVPNGGVLLTIPQYAEVKVLSDITATWCQTQYEGITGYTVSKYLTTVQPSATPEATETAEPEDEEDYITAWVNTPEGSLNLRSVPNGGVLLTIPQYAQVLVFSDITATWCQTQYNGVTGYTVSKYLTTTEPGQEPETSDTSDSSGDDYSVTAWVNTPEGSLNLRSEPNGKVLTTIPQYAQVTVLSDITATWCKTKYDGITGYTVSEYLTTTEPSEEPETTAAPTTAPTATPAGTSDSITLDPTLYEPDKEIFVYVRPPAGSSTLPLYEECSESSDKLKNMDEGEKVEVIMVGETWCKIIYKNQQGYCLRDGLSFIDE